MRAWVRVLVRSAAIDFMREQPEYVRGGKNTEPGWISLDTLASSDGADVPDSLAEKRREVESFLAEATERARVVVESDGDEAVSILAREWNVQPLHTRRLIKKVDLYLPVLDKVLAGHSYPEVGASIGISRREVELIVGYIEELLHARGFAA